MLRPPPLTPSATPSPFAPELLLVKCASIKPFFYALSFSSAPRNRNGAMAASGSWVGESGLGGPSNDVLLSAVIKKYCIVIILFLCALAVICIRMVARFSGCSGCSGCGSASLAVAGAASGSGRSPGKHKKRFARLFRIVNFYVSDSVCVYWCVCGRFSAAPAPAASRSNHTHCN